MSAESAALSALENRIRGRIGAQLDAIVTNFGAYLASVVRAGTAGSGTELLSRDDVHATLTAVLAGAQTRVENVTRTGYQAGAALAKAATGREFAPLGHDVPTALPDLGRYLDAVLTDVRAAFGQVLFDIHDNVRAAHDGVTGDGAPAARVLTTNAALKRAVRRLGVSVNAAGTAALHRGFSDAQMALYDQYSRINPFVALRKQWRVTDGEPCEHCKALDKVTVPIGTQFPVTDPRGKAVYRDLQGPPRHPSCRCRIALVAGRDTP